MHALPGTEGATSPFWSPDSRFVGFFADGKLKTIEVGTSSEYGRPQPLCDAPAGRGGAWNRAGVIVFSPNVEEAIYRIPAAGGQVSPVTTLKRERRETTHGGLTSCLTAATFSIGCAAPTNRIRGFYIGRWTLLLSPRTNGGFWALSATPVRCAGLLAFRARSDVDGPGIRRWSIAIAGRATTDPTKSVIRR